VVSTPVVRAEPVTLTHIGARAIAAAAARTPYELLRQTGGLEVHEQGQGPGFASDAALRGFSSDHSTDMALWVDGVPINEPVNGHAEGYNDWNVIFPGGIQDIDVIHGPTSALFGNFALAGVVNIRTLERLQTTQARISGGSYGRADAMVLTGFDHGADGGGVLGGRFLREDGFRPHAGYDLAQVHGRLVRDLAPGVTLDGGAQLYSSHWDSPGFLSEDEFASGDWDIVSNADDGGFKRRAQERVSLEVLTASMLWRSTVYASESRWQLFLTIPPEGGRFEGTGSQTEEEDFRHGVGLTSALTWPGARGELTVGFEGRWDASHYQNFFTTSRSRDSLEVDVEARQLSGALFAQSYANLTDRFRVDLGARVDRLATRSTPEGEEEASASHGVVSPKVGGSFRVRHGLALYANVARGFRSTDGIIDDPSLPPVHAWDYEGGVKIDAAGSLSVAAFRVDVSNEQTINPVTLETTNGGTSRRQGVELDWRWPVTRSASVNGTWTFLDARYRSLTLVPEDAEDEEPSVVDGLRVYNTSKYTGRAALDLAPLGAAWRLELSGTFNGPYSPFDEPGVVLGAYGLMHLTGEVHVGRFVVDGGVRNLLDRHYPELVAGHIVSPGAPRSFMLGIRTGL
jgi:outer membrane receptor protein involved in Fe transport